MQLHWLTETDVSIVTGQDPNGCDVWQTYRNSPMGRTALAADCPPEVVAEVLAAWGDAPTVEDVAEAAHPAPAPDTTPTLDQRTAALEGAVLALLGGEAHA